LDAFLKAELEKRYLEEAKSVSQRADKRSWLSILVSAFAVIVSIVAIALQYI
jgi:uncharacterized membrane protein